MENTLKIISKPIYKIVLLSSYLALNVGTIFSLKVQKHFMVMAYGFLKE